MKSRAHQGAACFHAVSEAEYRSIRTYGLRNPICVVPNGIDRPGEVVNLERENQAAEGRKVLLYLGRLHPKKNLVALLKAWESIQQSAISNQQSEEWMLTIAGWDQGGYERDLKSCSAKFGIQRSVTFLGPQFGSDKEACYQSCDAFILPSLSEGLPMAVLEAWAYGKPVLMTRECNLPEGFATGAAIEIGAGVDAIIEGLIALMTMSDAARREMGDRGRALVTEKFSWEQVGAEMRRVYEWVLGGWARAEIGKAGLMHVNLCAACSS